MSNIRIIREVEAVDSGKIRLATSRYDGEQIDLEIYNDCNVLASESILDWDEALALSEALETTVHEAKNRIENAS